MVRRHVVALLAAGSSLSAIGSAAAAQAPGSAPPAATNDRSGEAPPAGEARAGQAPVSNGDTARVERDDGLTGPDITVTGSRIVRDGYTAPTPVTVATTDDLVKSTPSNIPDGLNKLPQFTNSQSPSRSALNFANSPIHGNVLNLRGVGPTRTLILFDSLRVSPTTYLGTVDTNVLPNLLVQRVEVVTGGASAQYGSDAVSGVVNFVLNKAFTGVTGVAQAGVSEQGDNGNQRIGLAAGQAFAEGKGHILLSAEYFNSNGMRRNQRDYGRLGLTYVGSVTNCVPTGQPIGFCSPGGNGNPYTVVPNAVLTSATPFGKINATSNAGNPFLNTVFNADGSFRPNNPGTPTGTGPSVAVGGDGFTIPFDNTAIAPLETYQAFGRASYEVTPNVSVFAQGVFARADVRFTSLANGFSAPAVATLFKGNPYLPAAIDASLPAGGNVTVGQYYVTGPKPFTRERTDYWMATAGVEGGFGAGLKWDASYTHGDSRMDVAQSGLYDIKKAYAALDAVVAPAGNPGGIAAGTITCNVLLNPDAGIRSQYAGCQPINILGAGPATTTAAGYAYATGASRYNARLKQDSVVANLSGDLFDLPAGPVSFAVGGEYRRQSLKLDSNADPARLAGSTAAATAAIRAAYFAGIRGVPASQLFFLNTNVGTARGKLNVKEGYAELAVPILKEVPFFQELSLSAAGRITDYSTSGTVRTWKVGATWKPVVDLLLRGNLSRDIRAPNLFELFSGNQSALTAVNDPVTNSNVTVSLINGGNPALKPERADTLTLGGVLSPSFVPGLSVAVDYFRLKIKRQIGTLSAQQIVTNCFQDPGAVECGLVTRPTPTAPPSGILVAPANTAFLNTRGLDFDAAYRRSTGDFGIGLRLYASRLLKYETQQYAGTAVLDLTGLSITSGNPVGYPKWRGSFSGDVWYKNFGITISEQYTGPLRVAIPTVVSVGGVPTQFNTAFVDPSVKAVWYTDLTLRFDVPAMNGNLQLFGTVNNLFDREPPIIPSTIVGNNLPTNLSLYDTVGRAFTAGVRFKF